MSTRTNIRNAIGTALTSAGVVITANLIRGRNNTIASVSFPSAAVYAINEQIEIRSMAIGAGQQFRQLQVMVDFFTTQTSTTIIDDLFDTGSAAVEAAILSDPTLGGTCRDTHLSDTVEDSVIGDTYRTRRGTMKTFSVSGDVFWDPIDAGQVLCSIGSSVTVNLYPMGIAAAATYYSGAGVVTKFDVNAAFDGMVEGSISIEGNGTLSTLTV